MIPQTPALPPPIAGTMPPYKAAIYHSGGRRGPVQD